MILFEARIAPIAAAVFGPTVAAHAEPLRLESASRWRWVSGMRQVTVETGHGHGQPGVAGDPFGASSTSIVCEVTRTSKLAPDQRRRHGGNSDPAECGVRPTFASRRSASSNLIGGSGASSGRSSRTKTICRESSRFWNGLALTSAISSRSPRSTRPTRRSAGRAAQRRPGWRRTGHALHDRLVAGPPEPAGTIAVPYARPGARNAGFSAARTDPTGTRGCAGDGHEQSRRAAERSNVCTCASMMPEALCP